MAARVGGVVPAWRAWTGRSAHRRVLAAGVLVAALTGIVQLVSLAKEMVVVGYFGPGDQLDAFFIAYMLPSFAINVLGWSLNSALVPGYVTLRERGLAAEASAMLAGVTARTLTLLVGTSLVMGALFPIAAPWLASSFGPAKLELTTTLFYIMLPSLTLTALAVIWSGILNAHDAFGMAAASPALVPVATLVVLLAVGDYVGVHAVAVGVVAGAGLQCALLALALRRRGVPLLPRWGPTTPAIRDVFRQYAPAMGGAMLTSSTALVDQSMSAMLGSGSVATFNYGSKLVSSILGIGMVAIGTAVLPHFSRLAARAQWTELQDSLRRYALVLLAASVPAATALIVLSEPLIRLFFERGAFGPDDTRSVAWVQQLFALQIPFYLVGILVVRLISALRRNDLLLWGAFANVVLNVAFNFLFMRRLGVAGIALSTTLVYVAASTGLGIALSMHIRRLQRVAA